MLTLCSAKTNLHIALLGLCCKPDQGSDLVFGWFLWITILGARWRIIFKLLVLKLMKHGPYKHMEDGGLCQPSLTDFRSLLHRIWVWEMLCLFLKSSHSLCQPVFCQPFQWSLSVELDTVSSYEWVKVTVRPSRNCHTEIVYCFKNL